MRPQRVPTERALLTCAALAIVLTACRRGEAPATRVDSAIDSLPAPTSVPVMPTRDDSVADPIERLRRRLVEIGADNLLVVRGRITGSTTAERVLPSELHWGPGPNIVTTITIAASETICGPPAIEVRASYVGGRVPDGRVERTELMPSDLTRDREYVFILRSAGGEFHLELGREDLLTSDGAGAYRDPSQNAIPLTRLGGLCP